MGADNWAVCPQCLQRATIKRDKAIAKAEESYGKVSAKAYRDAVAEATGLPTTPEVSMREGYFLGIDGDGVFRMKYRSACENCDFGFEKKLEEVAFATKGKS